MLDLHCHLLPGIDDGAKTLDDALALAQIAVGDGISHAVMTPHILPGRYDNDRKTIARSFVDFRERLAEARIPLTIAMGAEVRADPLILPMLQEDRVPFLGRWQGDRVLLLENPHQTILPGMEKLVRRLRDMGIRPLIAHPERNRAVVADLERLRPLVEVGCLLQITARSLTGGFGDGPRRRAEEMLARDWVHIMASDAHNAQRRPPLLSEGLHAATALVDLEQAQRLVWDNPRALVASQFDTTPERAVEATN